MNNVRRTDSEILTVIAVFGIILLLLNLFVLLSGMKITVADGNPKISFYGKNDAEDIKENTIFDPLGRKEYAVKLKSYGFTDEAAKEFEVYLDNMKTRQNENPAGILYGIAEDFFDKKEFRKALFYYFKAEFAVPEAELKQKISSKIVICLENLGRSADALNVLNESSSDKEKIPRDSNNDSPVLAVIGDKKITLNMLNAEIQKLPVSVQDRISKSTEEKKNFLRQLVFLNLLFNKGKRLGIEKDSAFIRKMEDIKFQIISEMMLETETGNIPSPSQMDLKNYYEANKDKFKTKDNDTPKPYDEVKDAVKQIYLMEKKNEKVNELLNTMIQTENVQLFEEKL